MKRETIFTRKVTVERITIRSEELAVCGSCGQLVRWFSAFDAASTLGGDRDRISNLIASGGLDIRTVGGRVLICGDSIMRCIEGGY